MKIIANLKLIVITWMFGTISFGYSQTEIHVNPSASNKYQKGSLKAPFHNLKDAFKAVTKLTKNMKSDLVVYLHDGIHELSEPLVINESHSGTNNYKLIIKAYMDAKPIISGGFKVKNWTKVNEHIYKTELDRDEKLRSLFVNGKRMRMAGTETPIKGLGNWGELTVSGSEEWSFGEGKGIDGIKFSSKDLKTLENPEDVELVQFNIWTEKILCARELLTKGDTTILKLQQPYGAIATSMAWAGAINYKKNFIIRNAMELLDAPGEFYFDRPNKTLYYYSQGEDMLVADVIVPSSKGLIEIKGSSLTSKVKNIIVQGITFSHDHWSLMQVEDSYGFAGIQSLGLAIKYVPGGNWHPTKYNSTDVPKGAINVQNAESIHLIRNKFEGVSSAIAINFSNDVTRSSVIGNYFNDCLGNAINIGHPQHYQIGDGDIFGHNREGLCEFNEISNNFIRNVGVDFRQVEAITSFFVANTTIDHNDIANTPYGAITCGWWWGNSEIPASRNAHSNHIGFNRVGDTHQVLDDGGIIYVLGEQKNSIIEGNYLYNGPRAIYPDDGSAYWQIKNNVVENPSYKWMWLHLWTKRVHDIVADNNYVINNLLMDNGTNTTITNTHSFREDEFSDEAKAIMEFSGLQSKYKNIIPAIEPEPIYIHPISFKEVDVFH